MTTLIADAKLRAKLEAKLTDLAIDFSAIAAHAPTLAAFDNWDSKAENLRVTAHLVAKDLATVSVAQAFITAAEKLLAAEEAAIHESRNSRREATK